ncbi:MAG: FAD/NAD(P)-binding oxidoreductase [Chloroflexota bacterium]
MQDTGIRRYVIIGNGIAGTMAAETLRKNDPNCSITLIGNEPYPLYNRVSLPPFLKLKASEDKVLMRTPEKHAERKIDLCLRTQVTNIDANGRCAYTACGKEFPYDALLVASGGRPNPLSVPGTEDVTQGICNFQTLDDSKEILERINDSHHAVTVGGSYIAYELTEAFRARGVPTTWLIRGPRFLRRTLDETGGEIVEAIGREHEVEFLYGEEVASVESRNGRVSGIVTTGGRTISADLLGVGLGLTLNMEFLEGTGIETSTGILTDQHLRTNVPGIYAAGDVAEFYDSFIDKHNRMGTWDNSSAQGRHVALNMMGGEEPYVEVPTYTSTLFHSKIRVVGITPESHSGLEEVSTANMDDLSYQKLWFLNDRLVGAVAIGEMKNRKTLLQAIKGKQEIASRGDRERLFESA